MKISVFCDMQDVSVLETMMQSISTFLNQKYHLAFKCEYEEFRSSLLESNDLIIVCKDGEMGLVGCRLVRKLNPSIPLFWFSDNRNYWQESFQLNCTYFTTKPILKERIIHAFECYESVLYY